MCVNFHIFITEGNTGRERSDDIEGTTIEQQHIEQLREQRHLEHGQTEFRNGNRYQRQRSK